MTVDFDTDSARSPEQCRFLSSILAQSKERDALKLERGKRGKGGTPSLCSPFPPFPLSPFSAPELTS